MLDLTILSGNTGKTTSRGALAVAIAGLTWAAGTGAQEATPTSPAESTGTEEIVVTGFRASLNAALGAKQDEVGSIDMIVAEDIADFPDLNLAESLQRIPGVVISGDA